MAVMKHKRDTLAACLFFAPNLLGFLIFAGFPVILSIGMAFTNWDISLHNRFRNEPLQWIGLRNFYDLLVHPEFWKFLGNTLFLMMGLPIGMAGSLFLAVLLTRKLRLDSAILRWSMSALGLVIFTCFGLLLSYSGYGSVALVCSISAGVVLMVGFVSGSAVYRTLFFLPSFASGVGIFLLWKQIYNPITGPVNKALAPILRSLANLVNSTPAVFWNGISYVLWGLAVIALIWFGFKIVRNLIYGDIGFGTALLSILVVTIGSLIFYGFGLVSRALPYMAADGLKPPEWLMQYNWAKPAIMIMGLWLGVGSNNMLLYIAGISSIPLELYEAAEIDGAGRWQKFWYVTWPQLAPTTFFIFVMSVIGGIQGGFEQARAMTGGGPFGSTTTLSYFVFNEGFQTGRLGYACAVTWVIFIIVFSLTFFNYKFGSKYTNN